MISAHTLIKNEENFIWYSISSIIDYVDDIMIWDTGSTDKTLEVINELVNRYPKKVKFKEIGDVDENKYSLVRQQMLGETKSNWIFILDGDEIYPRESIHRVASFIKESNSNQFESIVVPTINLVGDIFHYQDKSAGQYRFGNRKGLLALRFINRNIPGLHIEAPYGKEGFFDSNNKPIQNRDVGKMIFIDAPYIHATHLARSDRDNEVMQRSHKMKHEIGVEFPLDYYYPEVFFISKPIVVPNIWKNMDFEFRLRSFIETPLRKLKRRLVT